MISGPHACARFTATTLLGRELLASHHGPRDSEGRTREDETGATGLEPATSGVTGRRSNQLNYAPGLVGL